MCRVCLRNNVQRLRCAVHVRCFAWYAGLAAAWVALLQRTATPRAIAIEVSATTVDAATGVATPAAKTWWELLCDEFSDVFSSLKGLPPPERVKHHI